LDEFGWVEWHGNLKEWMASMMSRGRQHPHHGSMMELTRKRLLRKTV
jgi:hypothetical protein